MATDGSAITRRRFLAGVACDNNALAHTTPIYVVVNGERLPKAKAFYATLRDNMSR